MLGWNAEDLSIESEVPVDTIKSYESGRTKRLTEFNETLIMKAFKAAGLSQVEENGGGSGWRYKKPSKT